MSDVQSSDIIDIARNVWTGFLGIPIDSLAEESTLEWKRDNVVSGSIAIEGAWDGHVVISCSREAAQRAAAAMFSVTPEEVTDEQISDAFSEIINITGGNIKALLPSPSRLSLPQILKNEEPGTLPAEYYPITSVGLACEGSPFQIELHRRREGTVLKNQ